MNVQWNGVKRENEMDRRDRQLTAPVAIHVNTTLRVAIANGHYDYVRHRDRPRLRPRRRIQRFVMRAHFICINSGILNRLQIE